MQLDTYTRVLEAAASVEDSKKADELVERLIQHLVSIGHVKLLPKIHQELVKVAARRKAEEAVVEVAAEKHAKEALEGARALGIGARHAVVNKSLIAGWRARGNGKLADHSAKAALIQIYKNVISA